MIVGAPAPRSGRPVQLVVLLAQHPQFGWTCAQDGGCALNMCEYPCCSGPDGSWPCALMCRLNTPPPKPPRCHLPKCPVMRPLAFAASPRVNSSRGRPLVLAVQMHMRSGTLPVMTEARVGEHTFSA